MNPIVLFFVLYTVGLGIAVVLDDARDARDQPEPDFEFDAERAALEPGGDELDDPARTLFGPFDRQACSRIYAEIDAL